MQSFIRVTEIWTPNSEGNLTWSGGLYGPHDAFRAASQRMVFKKNEGLPGTAWASRHPVILKDLQSSYFLRGNEAAAAGLTCAMALPTFAKDQLTAVVVLMCGSDQEHVGAVEAWCQDPQRDAEMGLVDGYYGTAELFEWTSRNVRFGRGYGLPGLIWKEGAPLILGEVFRPGQFLRWKEAQQVGLSMGLGIPCYSDLPRIWVLSFLSAVGTPIARRFEIWRPAEDGLKVEAAVCESKTDLLAAYKPHHVMPGTATLARVFSTGVPAVSDNPAREPSWLKASMQDAGLSTFVAVPVAAPDGSLNSVVAWYL